MRTNPESKNIPENATLQILWATLRKPQEIDAEIRVSNGKTLLDFQVGLLDELLSDFRRAPVRERVEQMNWIRGACRRADEAFAAEYRPLLKRLGEQRERTSLVLRATSLEAAFSGSLNVMLSVVADAQHGDVRVVLCKGSGGVKAVGQTDLLHAGDEKHSDMARALESDPESVQQLFDRIIQKLRDRVADEC